MEERVRCARCWKRVPLSARFCRRCGYALKSVPVVTPVPRRGSGPPFFLLILVVGWVGCSVGRFWSIPVRHAPGPLGSPPPIYMPQDDASPAPQGYAPPAAEPAPHRPHARRYDRPPPQPWYRPTEPGRAPDSQDW